MTQLATNLTPIQLFQLIKDVIEGKASSYTFLPLETTTGVYTSTHEILYESDKDITKFTDLAKDYLTELINKKITFGRNSDAQNSIFVSLFTTQSGLIRILWLHGKILSVLVGSKPYTIVSEKKNDPIIFSSYNFGFSPDSKAALSLTKGDEKTLMLLPMPSWPTITLKPGLAVNNPDANKSLSVAEGYFRHGSIEKVVGNDDTFFLVYPKSTSNFFKSGGSWGSGLPTLTKLMSQFDYLSLLDTTVLTIGEWNRYREYDNNTFMSSNDISANLTSRSYVRFSFNSVMVFEKSKQQIIDSNGNDLIKRKYSVFAEEDTKKYFDNPRYNVVFSPDKSMFYVCKSDKLKATALQTRITKSLREDFIHFLNWIGYYQLCADLDPANMTDTFKVNKLVDAVNANWAETVGMTLSAKMKELSVLASDKYKALYMGTTTSVVNLLNNTDIFNFVFKVHNTSQDRYSSIKAFDPYKMLNPITQNSGECLLSFNKKFSLDINLPSVLLLFAKGLNVREEDEYSKVYFSRIANVMSFLSTNFLMTDKVEKAIEKVLTNSLDQNKYSNSDSMKCVQYWHFHYDDNLKNSGQLLKTCMTLSPTALSIFNSVASLNTPTDILSWLELSRDYFITTLPQELAAKYGNKIASAERISAILKTGIDYYTAILKAAEPYHLKMQSTDETGD